jgi:hypothetical protein
MNPITQDQTTYYLSFDEETQRKLLCIQGDLTGFQGKSFAGIYRCPLIPENAAALRERLPWLKPQPLGLDLSFGFGDRIGLATLGHISAVHGTGIAPVFAQQSVRENTRSGRTPQTVLDDAMWAVFETDWRAPWGADADHIKEIHDLSPFINAGYSFYTIDPNEYVDNSAYIDSISTLKVKVRDLPWDALKISLDNLYQLYVEKPIHLEDSTLEFQEEILLRAAAKYGRAIAHVKLVSDYLVANVRNFDLEASVDETDTPTSAEEHYFIANELRRLGVPFVSLAPRFVGSFQKGVDYIGDIDLFNLELEKHVAVMNKIGGYKLSVHTGSDKFTIYPNLARQVGKLVHIKTAGTSYLEALRVVCNVDKPLFRQIVDLSRASFETDRATYHLSGKLDKVPSSAQLSDDRLILLFDQFDARQVLHVTFGSILDEYGESLREILRSNSGLYQRYLLNHFTRHLNPFLHTY